MTADTIAPVAADTFKAYGLGWRAVTCGRTVQITVRRLRHDHGSLRGYLDVSHKPAGARAGVKLAGEQINLSSGRDRSGFANRLLERAPGIEWRNIVDAFCVEVEGRENAGPQLLRIGNLPEPIDGGWLIEGLVERNQTTGLYADGGMGKSWIGLGAAVSVVTGVEVLPGYRPAATSGALYLDYETDWLTMQRRVRTIARGVSIATPNIDYVRMEDPLADCTEWLQRMVQENGIGLVVVDSVEAAMAGSVSAGAGQNEGPARMNRALRLLGVSALLIDHVSSEQGNQKEVVRKAYGSIFKRNWQRAAYHLKQSREPGDDQIKHLGLFNTKRNNGREFDPVGLAWEINDEWCRWWREEIDDPELEKALDTAGQIAAYLRREGASQPSLIAEGTGIAGGTVRSTLARRPSLFFKNDLGLWDVVRRAVAAAENADREPDALPF